MRVEFIDDRREAYGVEPIGRVLPIAPSVHYDDKAEVIRRNGPRRTLEGVEFAVLEWVDWFDHRRLPSSIGDVPPAEFEAMYCAAKTGPAKEGGRTRLNESPENPGWFTTHAIESNASAVRCYIFDHTWFLTLRVTHPETCAAEVGSEPWRRVEELWRAR